MKMVKPQHLLWLSFCSIAFWELDYYFKSSLGVPSSAINVWQINSLNTCSSIAGAFLSSCTIQQMNAAITVIIPIAAAIFVNFLLRST